MTTTNYTVKDIEALTENEVKAIAAEQLEIKGHAVYLVDFPGYFGYSACVFADGQHIYRANDYQLHHQRKSVEQLKKWYIEEMNNKLFTESELLEPSEDYTEQNRKKHFLINYYGMRRPHVSAFHIFKTEEERAAHENKVKTMYFCPVSYSYYDDKEFCDKCVNLWVEMIKTEEEKKENYNYWVSAFKYEMGNHEYCINSQGDYDVVSVFADVESVQEYRNIEKLIEAAGFTETQKKAYYAARSEYLATAEY